MVLRKWGDWGRFPPFHPFLLTDSLSLSPSLPPSLLPFLPFLSQVKQDAPEEDVQLNTIHDAVIASLRQQLEDLQQSLDFLRQSDHNLRLSLKDAEQRAMEAETKLLKSNERWVFFLPYCEAEYSI